jgi:hypothetical protein
MKYLKSYEALRFNFEGDPNLEREETELSDGIAYIIVDNNTACTLYDDTYLFSKDGGGLIASLKERIKSEKNDLIRDNLKLILNYYDETNEKVL